MKELNIKIKYNGEEVNMTAKFTPNINLKNPTKEDKLLGFYLSKIVEILKESADEILKESADEIITGGD